MSTKNDGGPAFPGGLYEPQNGGTNDREPWNTGMTIRDWFAGQAIAGVIGAVSNDTEAHIEMKKTGSSAGYFARCAYAVADAMLAEREK